MSATRAAAFALAVVLALSAASIFTPPLTRSNFAAWLTFIAIYFTGSALALVGYPAVRGLTGVAVRVARRSRGGELR